jgi:ERCC4-type nuclease
MAEIPRDAIKAHFDYLMETEDLTEIERQTRSDLVGLLGGDRESTIDYDEVLREQDVYARDGVEVWVCSNEKNHKAIVEGLIRAGASAKSVPLSTMVVGDYWIVRGDKILVIYEGKKIHDLRNSIITDHRYVNQTYRVIKSRVQNTFYLISGYISWLQNSADEEAVTTALVHLQFADRRLRVQYVNDDSAIIAHLASAYKYAPRYADGDRWPEGNPAIEAVKKKCAHKTMDTHENYWPTSLRLVYRMENKQAKAIHEAYPSVDHYLSALRKCGTERERHNLLENLRYQGKKDMERVGPAMSSRLYVCLVAPRRHTDPEDVLTRNDAAVPAKAAPKRRAEPSAGARKK